MGTVSNEATIMVEPRGGADTSPGSDAILETPNVAVVIVTWNRKEDVSRALEAVARQDIDRSQLDVIVTDNASTDGTLEYLRDRWKPERIVQNPTARAHEPAFAMDSAATGESNLGGFRSLTIIRNTENHGGCGGFNTGLSFTWDVLDEPGSDARPEFVWLVDDDIDLPSDALRRLLEAARSDETIGLVGSRTIDLGDRERTIETTVYLDPKTGVMGDEPSAGHRLRALHERWVEEIGGTRGKRAFSGLRDVDVVSACSLLARWAMVREVGLWDWRYFIYCDDADWCVRFARAGHRVVLNLDAVVYHTPWHHKLTPARLYYAQRNLLWLLRKAGVGRWIIARRYGHLLREAIKAIVMRRTSHAEIIRRSAHDAAVQVTGKFDDPSPKPEPIVDALDRSGALQPGVGRARVVAVCHRVGTRVRFAELRRQVREELQRRGIADREPSWIVALRTDMPGPHDTGEEAGVERVLYSPSRRSRLYRQLGFLTRPPRVVIVFDNENDLPVIRGRWNLQIDGRSPEVGRLERDGAMVRMRFGFRWLWTALRCAMDVARLCPPRPRGRYG